MWSMSNRTTRGSPFKAGLDHVAGVNGDRLIGGNNELVDPLLLVVDVYSRPSEFSVPVERL